MLHLTNGKVTGCSKQGHSTIFCEDCIVENCKDKLGNKYEQAAQEIALLVTRKQQEYGNSFGNAANYLQILYPNGINIDQYDDMLALVRDFDKSMRIANGNLGNEDAWQDKVGYALLAVVRNKS